MFTRTTGRFHRLPRRQRRALRDALASIGIATLLCLPMFMDALVRP